MRWIAAIGLALALAGCERGRTRNSAGGATVDEPVAATSKNLYRFVGVERALSDARKALAEERWDDALAAAQALLEKRPGHLEGKKIAAQAAFEAKNLAAFQAFTQAVEDHNATAAGASYHQIGQGSRYLEPARPDYERMRDQWTAAREAEARALVRAGRCRDAHRIARSADEPFPEMRPRLDVAAGGCHPATAKDEPEPEPVSTTPSTEAPPPIAGLELPPAPPPASPEHRVDAAPAPPTPAAAPPPVPVAAAPPPVVAAPPPVPAAPKVVSPVDLEALRIAGDRRPSLPAGARMIALRDKVGTVVLGLSLCVSAAGIPTTVDLLKPCDYSDANEKIVADVRAWRFRPYLIGGHPVPVCTRLVFVYRME